MGTSPQPTDTQSAIALSDLRFLEKSLRRRDAIVEAVAFAATRFLGGKDWDRDVHDVLRRLGEAAEAPRVGLYGIGRDEHDELAATLHREWHEPKLFPAPPVSLHLARCGLIGWAALERGGVVKTTTSALSDEGRTYFQSFGVESAIAVPVFAGDTLWGALTFADCDREKNWSQSVIESLQTAGATLGAALARRRDAEQLRESEQRYRLLTEAAFEGVFIHEKGILIEANPALSRIFGYDFSEMIGRNMLDFIPSEESRALIARRIAEGSVEPYEVTAVRKDGEIITAIITGRNITYRGRNVRVATVQDITDLKKKEEELRRQTAQLLNAQSIAHMGSWEWDIENNTLTGSEEIYRIYGFPLEKPLPPELILQRVHPDDVDLVRRTIDAAVRDGTPFSIEHRILRPDGDVRHFQVEGRVVADADGKPIRIIGAGIDVTARRRAELVERRLIEEEAARAARERMLGIVAHDLRNPLGTVLMAAELLEDALDAGSPQQKQLAIMKRAVDRMNRMVADLLDAKRLESGNLAVDPKPSSVDAIVGETMDVFRALAGNQGLEIAATVEEGLPRVMSDQGRVLQTLSNLIGNALKFTPRGGRVTLSVVKSGDDIQFCVADTGPGIAADHLPMIFSQFWQGVRTDKRGIGLGLAIAKGIVEAHGGRIWVESQPGAGTRFYFTLQPATDQ